MQILSKHFRFFIALLFICMTAMHMAVSANSGKGVGADKDVPLPTQASVADAKKKKVKPHALGVTQKKPAPLQ